MRQQGERVWHNIKANETTKLPRKHVFIHAETKTARRGKTGRQTWRLAVACYASGRKGYDTKEQWADYTSAGALWEGVSTYATTQGRTVLWAHNLGHISRICAVFTELPKRGWNLVAHSITPRATWLEWRNGKATILMVDTVAFFNTTLDQVGIWHGLGTHDVELGSNNVDDWNTRCRANVRIIATAVQAYLGWLEREDMGNWQLTGAAQSWAHYRHKHLTHTLTVHDDPDILAAERRAMWTGRCEAYWHGELKGERVYEFDFKGAYPRIARDYALPTKLVGPMPRGYSANSMGRSDRVAALAVCKIHTALPVVPTAHNGRILWPTGTFETTLWDIEIRAAIEAGATVQILAGWLYRKEPALKQWGEWILGELDKPDDEVPAWMKAMIKHWSRALIGRFSMTYNQWEDFGEAPNAAVIRGLMYDASSGQQTEIMQIGKKVWYDTGRVEWQHSMPMITGYVQAIGRVHLWDVMQQLPERSLIYVDTDSLLCTEKYVRDIANIADSITTGVLRLKRAWDGFAVYGPRQIITGEQVRVSGIPRIAERTSRNHFKGDVTDTLAGALRSGSLEGVITRDREWEVKGVDYRRRGTGFGWTSPIEIQT